MCLISVIMSVYKEEQNILEMAIDSILNQTYADLEFIIVNDNPLDKDLNNFLEQKAASDNRIQLICNKENLGLVISLNSALKMCTGKYVARMDADDIAYKDRLEKQIEWMFEKDIDILGTFVDYINENGKVIVNHNKQIYKEEQIKKIIRLINCVYHPTWLVKKEVYDELNGYRDINACEDYDFLLRANQKNKKIEVLNETLLYYRISEHGISHERRYEQLALMQFLQKNYNSIDELAIDKITIYQKRIKENLTMQKHFYKANIHHEKALDMKRKGKMISAACCAVLAMMESPFFLKLYMNMLLAKVNM